jgi:hypothetical protein
VASKVGTLGLALVAAGHFSSASAAPDPARVTDVLRQAKAISDRDGGRLWGQALYGPILFVDPTDRSVIANQADGAGVLKPSGEVWVGVLPPSVIVSDTPVEWSGKRWTELMWPLHPKGDAKSRIGDDWRRVGLAHEMFHRIQPGLGLTRPEIANVHLDTLQGRYLLQLEWRALARALAAPTARGSRAAVADALLFRAERYRLFPEAATDETALEIDEGIAEYTGVRLGLVTPQARVRYAIFDLSAFLDAPTFVRAFPYAQGPAWGLLLDRADPAWRGKLKSGRRLDQLLASGMGLPPPDFRQLEAREAAYDSGRRLYSAEVTRDQARRARLASLMARLADGPVVRLPLSHSSYEFNPQTLQPLGDLGTVYPTMHLHDAWGVLEVDGGAGALLDREMTLARVSASGFDPSKLTGDGWRLTLNKGWTLRPGPRKGDLVVMPSVAEAP